MRIEKSSFEEIQECQFKACRSELSKVRQLLDDFMKSDLMVAEVIIEPSEYKSVDIARQSITQSAKIIGFRVKTKVIGKRLFLIRSI